MDLKLDENSTPLDQAALDLIAQLAIHVERGTDLNPATSPLSKAIMEYVNQVRSVTLERIQPYLRHLSDCQQHTCGRTFQDGPYQNICNQPRDSEIHYAGTPDSHQFHPRPCSCGLHRYYFNGR